MEEHPIEEPTEELNLTGGLVELKRLFDSVFERLDKIDARLEKMDARLERVDERLD